MQVKINNKKYTVPELTFEHLTQMEEQGFSVVESFHKKQYFLLAMGFVCVVANVERDDAEKLLTQHVYGGGSVQQIISVFMKAVAESDFFLKVLGLQKDEEVQTVEAQAIEVSSQNDKE